jgi:hypothetical protein
MRDISREEWVGLYRKYIQTHGLQKTGACPGPGEIAAFFETRTSRSDKYRLLHHILECETCRNEFEWLRELNLRIAALNEEVNQLKRSSRPKFPIKLWAWAGLGAAAGLMALLLIVPALRISREQKPVYREALQIQFQDIVPAQGAGVERDDLHFSWKTPLPGGSFVFELFDPAMVLVWRSPATGETEVRLPAQVLHLLRGEQVYYWSVSGTWDDRPIIESPFFSFHLGR